jgi:hypothetical protein
MVAEASTGVAGFLMAFTDDVAYDSVNYQWFASRLKRFLYIDRVVVNAAYRGAGIGQALYQHAEAAARTQRLAWLVCEVDVEPPNPASLAFHKRLGFVAVGRQLVSDGKAVSLHVRSLDS